MSVHVSSWAWKQDVGDPTRKLVLLKLADCANDEGVCWPSQGRLAAEVGVSERTVRRHVGLLIEAGLLAVERRRDDVGRVLGNCYRVVASHRTPVSGGLPDVDDLSDRTSTTAPARARLRGKTEPSGNRQGDLALVPATRFAATVARRPVTMDEHRLADAVLAEFNRVFDTRFTLGAWGAKVVMRLREHPELGLDEHRAVIEANARDPWWDGPASPSVVYGNAPLFERAMLAGQGKRKLTAADVAEIAMRMGDDPGKEGAA